MSEQTVFKEEENQPQPNSQTALSGDNPSVLGELVGEGKKFQDTEALAKGKLESDKHIANLEEQLEEMRVELSKRATAAEVAEQIRSEQPPAAPAAPATPGLSAEEVTQIVQGTITNHEKAKSRSENVLEADKMFKSVHGDKAHEAIQAKANELGMSLEALQDIAAQSPTAFANMVGLNGKEKEPVRDQTPVSGGMDNERTYLNNPSAVAEGSKAWWTAKRKELGHGYWDPKIQQQLIKDKEEGRYDA